MKLENTEENDLIWDDDGMADHWRDATNDPTFPTQNEIDTLRQKFFVGPGDDETFRKWGDKAMELALEWLKNPDRKKIHTDISLPEFAKIFDDVTIPEHGLDINEVFEECNHTILNNSVRVNNPRYIGHMTSAVPWFSAVVDILITSMNQNQVKIETALASSFVERQTLAWLHRLIYDYPTTFYQKQIQKHSIALGNMTSGGTIGNLTALMVAREARFPSCKEKGLYQAMKEQDCEGIAILVSKRGHYSLKKSASILGFGDYSVIEIEVDDQNKIRIDLLEQKIQELRTQKIIVLAIVGIAGNTETGNIDPLEKMALVAKKENIWFHVDAAWGGAFLLSHSLRGMIKGIEHADSVVLDGHKLFYLPLTHGSVIFKSPKYLNYLKHNANYILRKGSVDLGRTSLEGSRRFNSLKLWFFLKILGRNGYHVLLKKSLQLTELMQSHLEEDADFECTSVSETCILTYRYVPQNTQKLLVEYAKQNQTSAILELNTHLNELNVELQKRQRENGKSFVSRTTLESTRYPQDIVVLRAVLTNLLTKSRFLKEILEEQRELGQELLETKFMNLLPK